MGKILEKILYNLIGISFAIEINFYECGSAAYWMSRDVLCINGWLEIISEVQQKNTTNIKFNGVLNRVFFINFFKSFSFFMTVT